MLKKIVMSIIWIVGLLVFVFICLFVLKFRLFSCLAFLVDCFPFKYSYSSLPKRSFIQRSDLKNQIKGQKFKKQLILSIFNVKSSINGNAILRISCFSKIGNFHFHNIEFLKLHFVKNIKIAGFCW